MSEQTKEVSIMMGEQTSSTEKIAETLQTAISKFKVEKTIK